MLMTRLLFSPRGLQCDTIYRKSWAGNLLMWAVLTFSPSFKVKRGKTNLKVLYNSHSIGSRDLQCETNLRKSWAGNFLMWSELALGHSFKVKQWFTGLVELSFRWIQICIGSSMH